MLQPSIIFKPLIRHVHIYLISIEQYINHLQGKTPSRYNVLQWNEKIYIRYTLKKAMLLFVVDHFLQKF